MLPEQGLPMPERVRRLYAEEDLVIAIIENSASSADAVADARRRLATIREALFAYQA